MEANQIKQRVFLSLLGMMCLTLSYGSTDREKGYDFTVGNIYYKILSSTEKTVAVSYEEYCSPDYNPDYINSGYSGSVFIPSSVTNGAITYKVIAIGENAFDNSDITSVSIPNTIESIDREAFIDCKHLTSISIPSSVKTIGTYAFNGCSSLTTISIPSSVTSIGGDAFANTLWYNNQPDGLIYAGKVAYKYKGIMPKNTTIEIVEGTLEIAGTAFRNCTGLTSIKMPNTITSIGWNAFYGCTSLISIALPYSLKTIDWHAFYGCTGLTSITIPNSVQVICGNAFQDCNHLKSVFSFIENPYNIESSVFNGSYSASPTLYVPEGLKEIYQGLSGWNQFPNIEEISGDWNTDIAIVVLDEGNGTVQIGNGTDAAISPETSGELIIPSEVIRYGRAYKVVSIAESAFKNCNKLTAIEIPSSITSIGNDAFSGCTGLQKVIVPDLKKWCAISFGNKPSNPLYYANHLYSDANTEIKNLVIPDGVTNIGSYAFIKGLFNTVTIPGSVTQIGNYSFYKCTSLASVKMAKGVGRIRAYAFQGCTALSSITFPEGMTRIGGSAFMDCTALESVEIPASMIGDGSLPGVGDNAFKQCSKLKLVKSSVLQPIGIGNDAFTSIATNALLYIPVGKMTAYVNAGWTNEIFGGGVVEVGEVVENFCIENGVTQGFIKNVVYPNDDYSYTKITDYTTQETQYRKDLPQPVIIEIPATNGGKSLILETYANGNMVRSDKFCVGQRALEIWNLIPQTQYTYKLYTLGSDGKTKTELAQGNFTTEGQVRMMKIDNVRNFRDIGGWKLANGKYIKYDKIFRSAELETTSQIITSSGINELLDVQGIGVEIDFGDYDDSPVSDRLEFFRGSDYQITPYNGGVQNKSTQYKNCFEKTVKGLREGKKILFHCSAGADRTGTFAFLLEGLLGVSESDMAKDYELTDFYWDGGTEWKRNRMNSYKNLVDYVKKNFPGNTINEKIEQMALGFGISPTDINDFRSLMTDYKALSEDDNLHSEGTQAYIGYTADLAISMSNKNTFTAYQFDLELPAGITIAKDDNNNYVSTKGNRYTDDSQQISVESLGNNTFRIISVSLKNGVINGSEGVLLSVSLKVDPKLSEGKYDASIKNIILTTSDETKLRSKDTSFKIETLKLLKGDANDDSEIDVADIVSMVNYIMGNPSANFNLLAADLNGDGEIDVFDVMMAINLVLSQKSSSRSNVRDANETTLESMFMTIDNEGVNLSIDNPGRFSAFQFELALPEGTILTEAKLADSKDTHLIKFDQIGTNCYRVMAVSLDNLAFSTTASELLRLTLSSNNSASAVIDNIRFVTPEGEKVLFSVSHENSATSIKEIVKEQEAVIYDLSGRKFTVSENLPKGVYIINNKKVVIK